VVGHPVVNASGDVIELVGTAMDVTEQHDRERLCRLRFEQIKAERTELRRMTRRRRRIHLRFAPMGQLFMPNQTVLDYTGLTLETCREKTSAPGSSTRGFGKAARGAPGGVRAPVTF